MIVSSVGREVEIRCLRCDRISALPNPRGCGTRHNPVRFGLCARHRLYGMKNRSPPLCHHENPDYGRPRSG